MLIDHMSENILYEPHNQYYSNDVTVFLQPKLFLDCFLIPFLAFRVLSDSTGLPIGW